MDATAGIVFVGMVMYGMVMCGVLYVLLCGQLECHPRDGCVRRMNTFLTTLPSRLSHACCGRCFGSGEDGEQGTCAGSICCREKNPLVKIFFIVLWAANVVGFLYQAPKLLPNRMVPAYHLISAAILIVATIASFLKACYSDPGFITKENYHMFKDVFPYDNLMHLDNRYCKTCNIIKPARSKHCKLHNKCVSKMDHYCIWLNNDVGEWNYRWFHLFLIVNFVSTIYATYAYIMSLYAIILESRLMEATFIGPGNTRHAASFALITQWMLTNYVVVIGQLMFFVAVSITMFLFWCYHLYLTLTNTTTNESFKWGDTKSLHHDLKVVLDKSNPRIDQLMENDWSDQEKRRLTIIYNMIKKKRPLRYAYNLGMWENVKQVIFPPSLYPQSKFLAEKDFIEDSVKAKETKGKMSKAKPASPNNSTPSASPTLVKRNNKHSKKRSK